MGKRNAPRVAVNRAHDCIDVLSHPQPVVRMENAGNRKVLYADQRGHAAADIHERAERLQVGHPGGDHVARPERCEQMVLRPLLGDRAGKPDGRRRGAFVQLRDDKTGGLADAGQDGDFPGVPLRNAERAA